MMINRRKATLILEDGERFYGHSFGYESSIAGEIVFNTAMNGYVESLTDPSYRGQIMVSTYPLVGNYGVPNDEKDEKGLFAFKESYKIHMFGLVVSDYSEVYSHWNAKESLEDWLKREQVFGLCDIDTRALAKHLRAHGAMKAKIILDGDDEESIAFYDPNAENQVALASTKEVTTYGNGPKKVVLVDCGVKENIIRQLLRPDVTIYQVPWDYDFSQIDYDGLFISNGPGDPAMCTTTINHIREAFNGSKPICGICMGNQLLSLAAGAKTFKMKYGHRSHNQPVREVGTNKCYITSQNHGFAVDTDSLPEDWEPYFVNLNDGTNEGIRHKYKPFYSVQFHPEANGGPTDTMFIFEDFLRKL